MILKGPPLPVTTNNITVTVAVKVTYRWLLLCSSIIVTVLHYSTTPQLSGRGNSNIFLAFYLPPFLSLPSSPSQILPTYPPPTIVILSSSFVSLSSAHLPTCPPTDLHLAGNDVLNSLVSRSLSLLPSCFHMLARVSSRAQPPPEPAPKCRRQLPRPTSSRC
jgi:hypothetical protein